MPFMRGPAPIRRTVKYLEAGKLIFRESVKVFTVNYGFNGDHHNGAKDFVFWHLPQVQYMNPNVQCITFKDLTPSPFIRAYLDDEKELLIDVDSRSKEEIVEHLENLTALCKSKEELEVEATLKEKKDNPANFGYGCKRHCLCEIQGQVPCPNIVPLPNHMRGKFKYYSN